MNGHTAKVFFYELRRNLRRKGYLFTTFGVPLIAIVLLLGYKAISSAERQQSHEHEPERGTDQAVGFQQRQTRGLRRFIGDVWCAAERTGGGADAVPGRSGGKGSARIMGEIPLYYVIAKDYLDTGNVTLVQPRLNISRTRKDANSAADPQHALGKASIRRCSSG